MRGERVTLEVRVHGKAVREYQHEGKIFIEGRKGSEYVLRVHNRTNRRVLVNLTVDGLSVIDGKEASSKDQNGYVLMPWQWTDIPGWRLDDTKVAKFAFSAPGESYASASGHGARNVGVIGCAVFMEKPVEASWYVNGVRCDVSKGASGTLGPILEDDRRSMTCDPTWQASASAMGASSCSDGVPFNTSCFYSDTQAAGGAPVVTGQVSVIPDLGTAFGKEQSHSVSYTNFVSETEAPVEVLEIRYESREALNLRGVDTRPVAAVVSAPSAFPRDGFCSPPPGWRGK